MNKITKWLLLAVFLGQSLVLAGPLDEAAGKGDFKKLTDLLESGVDIDEQDHQTGLTALMSAALNGHINIVEELLKRKAAIDAQSNFKMTAIMHAAEGG